MYAHSSTTSEPPASTSPVTIDGLSCASSSVRMSSSSECTSRTLELASSTMRSNHAQNCAGVAAFSSPPVKSRSNPVTSASEKLVPISFTPAWRSS